ncbi:histidine phosphatase family protein [Bengtsoniella intestinalis]|uniref:histidine phosphatase family protein n=1 Tax=Bengtsoniella intestinalis TaxID=3073143 RepID=UPI00391EE667
MCYHKIKIHNESENTHGLTTPVRHHIAPATTGWRTMILHLIRHGQTIATQTHCYCGKTDLPITPENLEQLAAYAAAGAYPALHGCAIYTTPLLRTQQTLQAIYGAVAFDILPDFQEVDFGIFELGHYDQLQHNNDYQAWIGGDFFHNIPPTGESFAQFHCRVLSQLEGLLAQNTDALVVAHGGTISAIMSHLFPHENKSHYQWAPKPCEGYSVTLGRPNTYNKITVNQ